MKLKLNKISAILLISIIMTTSFSTFAEILPNFEKVNNFDSSTYIDIYPNDWYYNYVGFAYEYGIMTGSAENYFSPNGNITLAEAITVAARLNAAYYGNTINDSSSNRISLLDDNTKYSYPVTGSDLIDIVDIEEISDSPKSKSYIKSDGLSNNISINAMSWFLPYMSYAVEQGIITASQFSSQYNNTATKEQVAYILYRALPDCYTKINGISPIPDVAKSNPYYAEILSMYEAGILTGKDEYGSFYPANAIVRSEIAAMVSRIVNTDLRISFTLTQDIPYKPLNFTWQYPYYGGATYSISMDISYYDYNYFASKPRTYNYSSYAQDDADLTGITLLSNTLYDMAISSGYTSHYDIASFIAAFVQAIEYQNDYEYKGAEEYPKYPIETLFDQGGDCEDTAVLLAKMYKILGYGAVLLVSDDHMAVGIQTSGNGNVTIDNIEFYYVETTHPGWKVGEVPNDMIGVGMAALYI